MLASNRRHGKSGGAKPRVLVDITTSLMLAGEPPVGISRVEGEIARRLLASDLDAIPVVFRQDGVLLALSDEHVLRIFSAKPNPLEPPRRLSMRGRAHTVTAQPDQQPSAASRGLALQATAALRRMARGGIASLPASVREDVRAILIHARRIARTALYRRPAPPPVASHLAKMQGTPLAASPLRNEIFPDLRAIVHPRVGDVFWTAGLYSNFVPLRTIGEMRARTGLRVVTTCYDLIRVTHPQFNPRSMGRELFAADVMAMLDASDLVLAISKSTRQELLNFSAQSGRNPPAVEVVPLGADLKAFEVAAEHQPALALPGELDHRQFALAVGTIEPRKNYGLLVRAWERLCAEPGFQLDLLIVGRPGFEAESSVSEIEGSPLFGSRIRWLDNCPDAALRRLYDACHVVLYPSFAEGWGLPVTEALLCGRHVIASNRGAIGEASLGLCCLLDPEDEDAWAAAIAKVAAAPRLDVVPPDPPRWDTAARMVEGHLRNLLTMREAV